MARIGFAWTYSILDFIFWRFGLPTKQTSRQANASRANGISVPTKNSHQYQPVSHYRANSKKPVSRISDGFVGEHRAREGLCPKIKIWMSENLDWDLALTIIPRYGTYRERLAVSNELASMEQNPRTDEGVPQGFHRSRILFFEMPRKIKSNCGTLPLPSKYSSRIH